MALLLIQLLESTDCFLINREQYFQLKQRVFIELEDKKGLMKLNCFLQRKIETYNVNTINISGKWTSQKFIDEMPQDLTYYNLRDDNPIDTEEDPAQINHGKELTMRTRMV